jgi:hypothetical protein
MSSISLNTGAIIERWLRRPFHSFTSTSQSFSQTIRLYPCWLANKTASRNAKALIHRGSEMPWYTWHQAPLKPFASLATPPPLTTPCSSRMAPSELSLITPGSGPCQVHGGLGTLSFGSFLCFNKPIVSFMLFPLTLHGHILSHHETNGFSSPSSWYDRDHSVLFSLTELWISKYIHHPSVRMQPRPFKVHNILGSCPKLLCMTTFHQSMKQCLWYSFAIRASTMNSDMTPVRVAKSGKMPLRTRHQKTRTLGKTSSFHNLFHFSSSCIMEWPTPLFIADTFLSLSSMSARYVERTV